MLVKVKVEAYVDIDVDENNIINDIYNARLDTGELYELNALEYIDEKGSYVKMVLDN